MTAFARLRAGLRRLVGSPERDRLAAYLVEAWADLDRELHRCGAAAVDEPWARTARALLLQAEAALARFDVHAGWGAALAGQRAILTNPQALDRVQRAAVALRREAAAKIDGWREVVAAKQRSCLIGRHLGATRLPRDRGLPCRVGHCMLWSRFTARSLPVTVA